jgi:esterase FrsA
MVNVGLPAIDVDAVRGDITDMWKDAPGGWVNEWSALADRYAAEGSHLLAALAYGWAKFPTLATASKRAALDSQLAQYQLAAPGFEVDFERRVLEVPYGGGSTPVAVHLYAAADLPADAPVLLASGGVDSWKMDVHSILVMLAMLTGARVMAFDIAGTGESAVPMTAAGGAEIVRGLAAEARALGNGVVAHLGISMGGYYSARSGLAGDVDGAIVLGGPTEEAFSHGPEHFGMDGIVGNALGFNRQPTAEELVTAVGDFSLRPLLDQDANVPMLVINGADDVHVPQHDTLVFNGRRATEVHLIDDTGHCAITKLAEVLPLILDWLERTFASLAVESA